MQSGDAGRKKKKKSRLRSFFRWVAGGGRPRAAPCLTFSLRPHPLRYHIGQGLLIVRRQAAENGGGERGEKGYYGGRKERGSSEKRKEGQTGGIMRRRDESSEGIWSLYSPA